LRSSEVFRSKRGGAEGDAENAEEEAWVLRIVSSRGLEAPEVEVLLFFFSAFSASPSAPPRLLL